MEWITAFLTAFILIVPVELPDKTFVATLVLSTRYRPLPVWLGVSAAFAVQCAVAAGAGALLAKLPKTPVTLFAALMFAVGAVILFRGARKADAEEAEAEAEYSQKITSPRTGWRAALASFTVLFAAEWGDLSQLATAALVARGGHAVAVGLGAFVALTTVAGAAVLLGRWLLKRVRLTVIRYVGAAICAILATLTVVSLV
ncbi:MAG: TMEM165/GDT1 family protein [Hamadaea sp.]|uniref:TMEM165/GDT1 family protein n=1 Tax=Hamadaea sp. NPDC050747 TaxID=3155789 RepID=UPI00182E7518|nr:TMEM165/GDT1 family protein [Hamadaea sp.]NUR48211.1 TMEM165/GDT1 family protein [Hamadaea sp.]NUR72176.1 TMEM165/GDT1 family protein [Hamadaea sp.]NUT02084.1 TMEM165/GDT1 family protein [Hamadaea sp.]